VTSDSLHDKVIVIVGGTTGLGLSASAACVAAGARLVIVSRSEANCRAAAEQLGPRARWLAADATDPDTSRRAVELACEAFGRLDGLYHVAGGSGRASGDGPLDQISDEGWESTLRWNLTSLFYSNRAAAEQFLRQKSGGAVLNMSSVLAWSPSPKHFATHAYAAAKAAVIGLTKASAAYYAPQGIRFNVIAPALVDTPMAERAVGNAETMQYVKSKQPLDGGRVGAPSDLDAAVVYFLCDQSCYVTGQVLAVDGGWSVSEGRLID
jgi:NAD(P)-dependent dehydrogenase (short-subunit alcohol dehydrogenase family)